MQEWSVSYSFQIKSTRSRNPEAYQAIRGEGNNDYLNDRTATPKIQHLVRNVCLALIQNSTNKDKEYGGNRAYNRALGVRRNSGLDETKIKVKDKLG